MAGEIFSTATLAIVLTLIGTGMGFVLLKIQGEEI